MPADWHPDWPFSTSDEYEALMPTLEEPSAAARPCECSCECFGEVFNDDQPAICLACQHGFHTEDE